MSKFAKDYLERHPELKQTETIIVLLQEILQSSINIEDRLRKLERSQPNIKDQENSTERKKGNYHRIWFP